MKAKLVHRGRRAIRSYGLGGLLRHAWAMIRARLFLSEQHIWYELDPRAPRPKPTLGPSLELRTAQPQDLVLLDQLETISPAEGQARIDDGNDVWVVLEAGRPLFSCCIFRRLTPAIAAPNGRLALEPEMVCLEDSVTGSFARGRGVAPSAWAAIADTLVTEGVKRIITKVAVDNSASRRAVEKVGFESVAVMSFKRRLGLSRTSIQVVNEMRGAFFAQRLAVNRAGDGFP